jgi:hypothetical protein
LIEFTLDVLRDGMSYREIAKQISTDLYPDVASAGSLAAAFRQALGELPSVLEVDADEPLLPFPYARVARGPRFSQVYVAANERLFLVDFWSEGVAYGKAACSSLTQATDAIHRWIAEGATLAAMEARVNNFEPTTMGRAHEAGRAVEHQWDSLLKRWKEDDRRTGTSAQSPTALIEAARMRPELRQLFPFTSLAALCFSRTTGYPFTDDCPHAVPIGHGRFRAHSPRHRIVQRRSGGIDYREAIYDVIGEGTVEEVVKMLVDNLPPNCGPAVGGTAEDLLRKNQSSSEM